MTPEARPLEERVRRSLDGDDADAAATAVLETLGPAILRFLRSLLRDEGDAGDAFSQWAEHVWRGLPAFRFEASLKTWSYRLARSAARDLRDQAWRKRGQRLATGQASMLAQSIRTRSALVAERQVQALDELRASLAEAEQALLVLRIDHGLPWEEVAAILAGDGEVIDAATLMKRFERLKAKLARLAQERGLLSDG